VTSDPYAAPDYAGSASYSTTAAVSSVTLTADVLAPQPVGTTIVWSAAAAHGTAPLSYQWSLSSDGGASWTVAQPWTINATPWAWTPTAVDGDYRVSVAVRSANNTYVDEATATSAFVIQDGSGAVVSDAFSAANGTAIQGRVPTTAPAGVTWSVAGTPAPTVQGNQVPIGSGSGPVFATVDPSCPMRSSRPISSAVRRHRGAGWCCARPTRRTTCWCGTGQT
jgi:hypothetical protein